MVRIRVRDFCSNRNPHFTCYTIRRSAVRILPVACGGGGCIDLYRLALYSLVLSVMNGTLLEIVY